MITEADLVRALAEQVGLEFVDLAEYPVDPSRRDARARGRSPAATRRSRSAEDGRLVVAMADPSNVFAVDDIRAITGAEVQPVVATAGRRHRGDRAVLPHRRRGRRARQRGRRRRRTTTTTSRRHARSSRTRRSSSSSTCSSPRPSATGRRTSTSSRPSSDLRVRFRIDGVLHEVMRSPEEHPGRRHQPAEDHGRHQHRRAPHPAGRPHLDEGRRQAASTCASRRCRRCTARRSSCGSSTSASALLRLDGPRLPAEAPTSASSSRYRKPYGTILVTGPTGSGKSTTLYATLNIAERRRPQHHHGRGPGRVPAARHQPGAGQPQGRADLRRRRCGRSCASDPDIVLIGEIRDQRDRARSPSRPRSPATSCSRRCTPTTPPSRRHAARRDGRRAVPRRLSALDCVVAQRLARRLCDKCKEAYEPDASRSCWRPATPMAVVGRVGRRCTGPSAAPRARSTGYRGRLALHEVMPITEEIERHDGRAGSSDQMKAMAVQQGMITLREDGLAKVGMGLTSIEEVARVVK